MDKFEALPEDKKRNIIKSAMEVFGNFGYKKASINDIAKKSEISKSMVFYYFGSKLDLYCYLVDLSYVEVVNILDEKVIFSIGNFFDRLNYISTKKLEALHKLPGVMKFLTSFYFEEDKALKEYKKSVLEKNEEIKNYFMLTELDYKIFKDSVDPTLVLKIIGKWNAGLVQSIQYSNNYDFDALLEESKECLNLMKMNFCKEEYL